MVNIVNHLKVFTLFNIENTNALQNLADKLLEPTRKIFHGHTVRFLCNGNMPCFRDDNFSSDSSMKIAIMVIGFVPGFILGVLIKAIDYIASDKMQEQHYNILNRIQNRNNNNELTEASVEEEIYSEPDEEHPENLLEITPRALNPILEGNTRKALSSTLNYLSSKLEKSGRIETLTIRAIIEGSRTIRLHSEDISVLEKLKPSKIVLDGVKLTKNAKKLIYQCGISISQHKKVIAK